MAGSQIATSVTILNTQIGYNGISLSNRDNDSAPQILQGSFVEISNAFFYFGSNETVTGWSSITTGDTAYIKLTPAGTAGSQTVTAGWSSTAPTYVASKGGWYLSAGSSIRYIYSSIKSGASSYTHKEKLSGAANTASTNITTASISAAQSGYSALFTVTEPGVYNASISAATATSRIWSWIQQRVDSDYTGKTLGGLQTGTVLQLGGYSNVVAFKEASTTLTVANQINLLPGKYRIAVWALTASTATITLKRTGRLSDVTQ